MILGALGSDKSVTTIDSIMTEIFTGIKPDEIRIYREEENKDKDFPTKLEAALKLLGLNARVKEIVIGDSFSSWKERMSLENVDILDVTPGRKYMAYAATVYSHAKDVRYAYLKTESEGYKVFGYVPLTKIKVFSLRDGKEIPYDPPLTKTEELISKLNSEGLTAFYNLLSLHGEVEVLIGDEKVPDDVNDNYAKICLIRAGYRVFEEEKKIVELAAQGYYFLADTNAYINLGPRLGTLTQRRLLASRSVYNEFLDKTQNTQKQSNTIIFDLGMYTYTCIHRGPLLEKDYKAQGDVPLILEAKAFKQVIGDPIALITSDFQVANRAGTHKLNRVIFLDQRQLKSSTEGNIGELLFCLSYRSQYFEIQDIAKKEVEIRLNGNPIASLQPYLIHEGTALVKAKDKKYNYAKLVEKLYEISSRPKYYC